MLTDTEAKAQNSSVAVTVAELLEEWRRANGGEEVVLAEVVADGDGLTEAGRLLMRLLAARDPRPRFDASSRELWYRGRLVKRLGRAGSNQLPVLLEFERLGWPRRIDDPLPADLGTDAKVRRYETVNSLNDKRAWNGVRFTTTDGGLGWEAEESA